MKSLSTARVQALLFDFDHTLIRSPLDFDQMRRVVVRLCHSYSVEVDDPDTKMVLEIVSEAAAELAPADGQRLRRMADECIRDLERAAALAAEPIDGVPEALARLQAEGRSIAIITRNCRDVVLRVLEVCPLDYDLLLSRDDVTKVKPDPAHAQAALAALGCSPENALLVGDYKADVACAMAAGIRGIGVATGASTIDELLEAGALAVLPSAAVLPAWLAERGW